MRWPGVPDEELWCPTCETLTLHMWAYVNLTDGRRLEFHSCVACQGTARFEHGVTVGEVFDLRRWPHQQTPFEGWSSGDDPYEPIREQ